MSVGTICNRSVETARATDTAAALARRMTERRVGSVVVVDERSRPMGIISDRDIMTRVVAQGLDPAVIRAGEIMSPMPTTVLDSASIENALGHMRIGHLRRLPVVNGSDELVGLVALDDILRHLGEEFSLIEGLIDAEAPVRAVAGGKPC